MNRALDGRKRRTQQAGGAGLPTHIRILIAAQVFSAFLTETRFLPVKHNVGVFEFVAVALTGATLVHFVRTGVRVRFHRVMLPLALVLIAAALSNSAVLWAGGEFRSFQILSTVVLAVSLLLLVVWYNVFLLSERNLDLFLRAVVLSAGVIGMWVLLDQIRTGGAVGAAGPFRSRAHAGIYMASAFWLVLLFANWPLARRTTRWLAYPVVAMILYVVAASGRRSVYIALGAGLVGLMLGSIGAGPRTRRSVAVLVTFSIAALGVVYFKASEFWKPAAFFRDRVGMVSDRVATFSGMSDESADDSFVLAQREGGLRAFRDHPILGIGWGGFPRSPYSPTGHEMHSTPTRFLAELGMVGVVLYLWFTFEIIRTPFLAWRANGRNPFEAASLILLVAMLALSVSYIYNRQMTDRTFWLILVFAMGFETWTIRRQRHSVQRGRTGSARRPLAAARRGWV